MRRHRPAGSRRVPGTGERRTPRVRRTRGRRVSPTDTRPAAVGVSLGQVTEAPDVAAGRLAEPARDADTDHRVHERRYADLRTNRDCEGEIAVRPRSARAARGSSVSSSWRLSVLASVAGTVGLIAANKALTWGIESVNRSSGGAPFWMTPGLKPSTILYGFGLAILSAALLSILPALRATRRARAGEPREPGRRRDHAALRPRLDRRDDLPGGADRDGHPGRHGDGERGYVEARYPRGVSERPVSRRARRAVPAPRRHAPAFEARRTQALAALERRVAQEPGVIGIAFSENAPASLGRERFAAVEAVSGAGTVYDGGFRTSAIGPGFFDRCDRTHRCRARIRLERLERHGPDGDRQRSVRARLFARGEPQFSIGARRRYRQDVEPEVISRSWASFATSACIRTTRATKTRRCFTPPRWERSLWS